jgi:hypothetical protein
VTSTVDEPRDGSEPDQMGSVVAAAMGDRNIGHGSASDAASRLGVDDDISENMKIGVLVA